LLACQMVQIRRTRRTSILPFTSITEQEAAMVSILEAMPER
jgi:hypothetical protein